MKASLSFALCVSIALSVVEALRPEGLQPDLVLTYEDTSSDATRLVFANPAAPNPADIGMRLLLDQTMHDAETSEEVAAFEGICTLIGFADSMYPKLYCSAVVDFGDENILAAQGTVIQDGNDNTDGVMPIVSGTGIYDGATGWLATTDAKNGTSYAYVYLTNKEIEEVPTSEGGRRLMSGIGATVATVAAAFGFAH